MKIIDKAKSTGREVRRTRKIAAEIKPLSITSLLDVLTIVLAFMIKNVSMEAQKITIPERMVFPTTMSADQLEESMGTTVVKVYPTGSCWGWRALTSVRRCSCSRMFKNVNTSTSISSYNPTRSRSTPIKTRLVCWYRRMRSFPRK
jgi:hypothetical protein